MNILNIISHTTAVSIEINKHVHIIKVYKRSCLRVPSYYLKHVISSVSGLHLILTKMGKTGFFSMKNFSVEQGKSN